MGDPERLLAAVSDGDELERELLGSIRNVSPPPGAKRAAWDAIAQVTSVAAAGAGAAAASGAAAHAAAGAKFFTAKVLVGVALVGSTVATGGYWVSRHSSQPVAVDPPPERRAPARSDAGSATYAESRIRGGALRYRVCLGALSARA